MTKPSTIPPLRVSESVRAAAEASLMEGETLSVFVLEAIQLNIQCRAMQQEFVARGLAVSSIPKPSNWRRSIRRCGGCDRMSWQAHLVS